MRIALSLVTTPFSLLFHKQSHLFQKSSIVFDNSFFVQISQLYFIGHHIFLRIVNSTSGMVICIRGNINL